MSETVTVSMRLEDVRLTLDRTGYGQVPRALVEESEAILLEAERIGKPALAAQAAASLARVLTSDGQMKAALAAILRGRQATQNCDAQSAAVELDLREAEAHQRCALLDPVTAAMPDGAWERALACCRRALTVVEIERVGADAPYLQAGFMRGRTRLYEVGARAMLGLGDKVGAIQLLDSAKARGLPPRGHLSSHIPEALVAFRTAVGTERMLAWRALMRRLTAPQPFAGVTIAAAQAGLAKDQAALWWGWLDETTLLVAAFDRDRWDAAAYPVSDGLRRSMRSIARGVIQGMGSSSAMTAMERRSLGSLLLPPWAEAIVLGCRRIALCPHRVLHGLPLQITPTREGPLGLVRGVSFIPSLASLVMPIPVASCGLAAAYATSFREGLHSLPEAADMAKAALAQEKARHGPTIRIDADKPARDCLLKLSDAGKLRGMREIWFCCHGQNLLERSPLESRLELGKEYLDGLDLATLDLSADIVVLLACHAGKRAVKALGMANLPADDLLGLQGALRVAGARQVLAPQWPVEPRLLMAVLPRMHALSSEPKDLALRAALAEFVEHGGSLDQLPEQWAPLQLVVFGQAKP
jgi:hypothetical protein